jgi:hypothetical protein
MPSWADVKAEAVARGFRRADAPARGRGACFQRLRRPQQQKRKPAIAGGELQLLAGLKIEPVDHSGDGLRGCRMQSFRHGPQGFFAVRRLDQDQAGGIETEAVQSMSGKPALLAVAVSRHDEDDRVSPRQTAENRHEKAEGGRGFACRRGNDFMQRPAGKAAFREVGIKHGNAEGQGLGAVFAPILGDPQQATQFRHDDGAALCWGKRMSWDNGLGKGNGLRHLAVSLHR